VHGSIWSFAGDPDHLLASYDAMLADIPVARMRLHLCLNAADGIVIVDTCPSREDFAVFAAEHFPPLRRRYDLPEPRRMDDFPVHAAFVNGERIYAAAIT
jgi:hypothetical protein